MTSSTSTVARTALRPYHPALVSDGTIEALKWAAALLMFGDHVNRYLLQSSVPALFDAGRLVMPLFGILLALNLSRPSALASNASDRTVGRLLVVGLIATVPYMLLGGTIIAGLPLNILFTLGLSALIIQTLQLKTRQARWGAVVLFAVGGVAVEFWWPGVAVVVGTWLWRTGRPKVGLAMLTCGMIGLCAINGNLWALLVVPLVWFARYVDLPLKRQRAFFYVFYPVHLAVIYILALARL